jgi:ubiquitin-protein ligase
MINTENWKPATRIHQGIFHFIFNVVSDFLFPSILSLVLESLLSLVVAPQLNHPLRNDLAEEYEKTKPEFLKKAAEHTKQHAEKRQ